MTNFNIFVAVKRRKDDDAVVITTALPHSAKPELKFCAGSYPARGLSEVCDGENLQQLSWLEIRPFVGKPLRPKKFYITFKFHIFACKQCFKQFYSLYWRKQGFRISKNSASKLRAGNIDVYYLNYSLLLILLYIILYILMITK